MGAMYSVRPLLQGVIGHIVHARMDMQALHLAVLEELESGYRPTYRGHEWARAQFTDLEHANAAIEAAFHLLKGVQFPEMRASRHADVLFELQRQVEDGERDARNEGGDSDYSAGQFPPGYELGYEDEESLDLSILGIEFGFDTR